MPMLFTEASTVGGDTGLLVCVLLEGDPCILNAAARARSELHTRDGGTEPLQKLTEASYCEATDYGHSLGITIDWR